MSWMDSWSRPKKHAATPPPLYLTAAPRKSHTSAPPNTPVKYCSSRCRTQKPGAVDRRIEDAFVMLLNGEDPSTITNDPAEAETPSTPKPSKPSKKTVKGDPRIIVDCTTVEEAVFGSRHDPEKTYGRRKNRAFRGIKDGEEWKTVDMMDPPPLSETANDTDTAPESLDSAPESDGGGGGGGADGGGVKVNSTEHPDFVYTGLAGKVRPRQSESEVNGSVGGEKGWAEKIDETPEMLAKRREGQRKAEEREMVRKAARRGCAFGFAVGKGGGGGGAGEGVEEGKGGKKKGKGKKQGVDEEGEGALDGKERRRKCEAVMSGQVVESSFAKGDWGIRWREG
ncbi:hypothetical protein LTS18_005946 [Coniosporium uncinatum]|uniref:Uncharacterized protein n=1 Tax=Coniosporium uncinatum TaxID=93489 RepID=A0ACC3DB74_9PEZI|nr:hypothetical protein LTS18_005946 [Coniosporium uncinatum]